MPSPIPVTVTCRHCRSGLEQEPAHDEDADIVWAQLLADALAAGWQDRPDGLYCPRCVRELFAPRLQGLSD